MKSFSLEINDGELLHIWEGSLAQIMVSNEDTKTLRSFPSIDDAINGLYMLGYKEAARKLNGINKEVSA